MSETERKLIKKFYAIFLIYMLKGGFLGGVKSAREIKTRICPNLRFKEPTMHDIIFLVLCIQK